MLISAPKSSVTLLTPDIHQAKIHPRIFIENSHLPLVKCPRILDPSWSFNKHSQYVQREYQVGTTFLRPWQVLHGDNKRKHYWWLTRQSADRSSITSHLFGVQTYMTPTTEKSNTHRMRIATGCHKMSSIDHLHTEAEMLKVWEHSELLSAQYLARCLEPRNVCHPITTRAIPERQMKETLYTRHQNTVEPMMVENDRKATLQALHTAAVVKAVQCHERNVVLDGRCL